VACCICPSRRLTCAESIERAEKPGDAVALALDRLAIGGSARGDELVDQFGVEFADSDQVLLGDAGADGVVAQKGAHRGVVAAQSKAMRRTSDNQASGEQFRPGRVVGIGRIRRHNGTLGELAWERGDQ
jgi:hypothetical protein